MSYGQEWLLTEWECPSEEDDNVMEVCTIYDLTEKVKTGEWLMTYVDDCWVLTMISKAGPYKGLMYNYSRHYSKVGRY